ncbi:helix-turn-helix transcriptional regulator [Actinomadura sp. 9N407]|uniref:helix-turn-helix transcriptional regulator n=1 Tax=Actinomadura sp. 9N407 TaxID=3375154 RepID=UPI003792FCCA
MQKTSARLLRLLSLLQTPRSWTGPQLAERLDVTTRTVRNDVERLRDLGYPVNATPGAAGGYRLGAGASLPPLLLDDDEAVAVVVGLRTAASGPVSGIEESSLRALAKLEQVLPSRLRHRVNTLQDYTVPVPGSGPRVDAEVLTTIAGAARDHRVLRFGYRSHDGTTSLRNAEPHRLVHAQGRWYLLAWDVARDAWRTFRADRIEPRPPLGARFAPRETPEDVASYVAKSLGQATWNVRAQATVNAPAATIAARLPPAVIVEPSGPDTCVVHVGSDDVRMLALYLGMIDADFQVTGPPELVDRLRLLAARYTGAT